MRAGGTDGNIISFDASGNPVAVATGNDGQVLTSSGAGAVCAFEDAGGGGKVHQIVTAVDSAVATGTTIFPVDDTIPQNTEGDEFMTIAITPSATDSKLVIEIIIYVSSSDSGGAAVGAGLFQDSTAGALAAGLKENNGGGERNFICFTHIMTAGTTSSTTFKVRAGYVAPSTTTFNGMYGTRQFGGVGFSTIVITEYLA